MSSELEPALSETEWTTIGPNGVGHPPIPSTLDEIAYLDAWDLPKAVAIANHMLPADSPYKITRADIYAIRSADTYEPDIDALHALSAKLSALLPP